MLHVEVAPRIIDC
jgi:hypothetical protein